MATLTKEERRARRQARKDKAANQQNRHTAEQFEMDLDGDPLKKQVGGAHYVSGYQHVEFCQHHRIPWCESAALKYILRHRRKNGKEDLEKAKHYVEFVVAIDYARREEVPEDMAVTTLLFKNDLDRLIKENAVPPAEERIIRLILDHQRKGGDERKLADAIQYLKDLIAGYDDPMDLL